MLENLNKGYAEIKASEEHLDRALLPLIMYGALSREFVVKLKQLQHDTEQILRELEASGAEKDQRHLCNA